MNKPLIDHWSYSALLSFLNNPMGFKKTYILKQYDNQKTPTAVVGSAGHKALEMHFQGMTPDDAIAMGMKMIDETSEMGIDYGKTGTRAKIVSTYIQAINFAFAELPEFYELLGVEEGITTEMESIAGGNFALPGKAKIDIIARNKLGELEITDWKFTKGFTDPDEPLNVTKWLQSMFNYYIVKAKYGEAPKRMIFQEIKVSKNSDGGAQMRPYVYEFGSTAEFAAFEKLVNQSTKQLHLPGYQFLPNPSDMFEGQHVFEIYLQGIMGVEAPIAAPKKLEQTDFVEKRFVESATDQVQNKDLTPEERIRLKFQEFVGAVKMHDTHVGPSVTQYTLKVGRGVPMGKIARIASDLQSVLEAKTIRLETPIPGTSLVGIEVPSVERKVIDLAEHHMKLGTLQIPIGVNVMNETIYKDLHDMPHLLIAGATGAGKSVMLNVIINSLTTQLDPSQLELILVDPKQVEFAPFEKLPHLVQPVVYDNRGASEVLAATVQEMEKRYKQLRRRNVRNIKDYNAKAGAHMPYRVVILDEFADLMMSAEKQPIGSVDIKTLIANLETYMAQGNGKITQKAMKAAITDTLDDGIVPAQESIIRIAQKARAVGIHLVLATQRPSADVVTGLIRANIPTKIAFMTSSRVNSQIVLDEPGAEELTGKGDMLFDDPSVQGLQRLQGLYS